MNVRLSIAVVAGLIGLCLGSVGEAALSRQEMTTLFVQANEAFGRANAISDDSERAGRLYQQAILAYEKIIDEGGVENAKLYYNLGNAYFLKNDIGRAILNYRRAERLAGADRDIAKNLAFARSRRVDTVSLATEKRVLQTLFFWHYDFSLSSRFAAGCVGFAMLCCGLTFMVWRGRSATMVVICVVGIVLTVMFAGSVIVETASGGEAVGGVVIAAEVIAHQGDWESSPASFKEPLHAGLEFGLIEQRRDWYHIRLGDGSDGWIKAEAAELIQAT